jgi:hypothetical protein
MKWLVLILFAVQSFFVVTEIGCDEISEIKYIRKMLKEYALCQCISEGIINVGIKNFDGSAGKIRFSLDVEPYTFWKIDSVIDDLYLKSNVDTYIDGRTIRNYNFRCLKFYESNYLDSLIKTFDLEIDVDSKYDLRYKNDSAYFEKMIIDSQKEVRNE